MQPMATKLLRGDRALVTGAANGIGRAIARALAAEGATVLGSDITRPGGWAARDFIQADLAQRDGWKALLADAEARLGRISLFVHCASPRRLERHSPLALDEATWDQMMDVNLRSGFFLGREIGRLMRKKKIAGRLLFVTSLHRSIPRNLPHYSAAKAGLTMVTKELARAFAADGIRVNAIAPGAVPGGGFVADDLAGLVRQIPMGRPGTPDDIAQMAVAVLSQRFGRYVTGTTIDVDGGLGLLSWIPPRA
ncbi:MAG: SDR family oxidoreductase [Alphaproteobacteria bacterium]|nr:SDR family oxidoreductase [Alphaproteobacteria bacterium]